MMSPRIEVPSDRQCGAQVLDLVDKKSTRRQQFLDCERLRIRTTSLPQHAHLLRGEYARPLALLGELASKLTRLHSALHTIHINPYADHYKI